MDNVKKFLALSTAIISAFLIYLNWDTPAANGWLVACLGWLTVYMDL